MQNWYDGYSWIRVPKYEMDESKPWQERYRELERHHIAETTFLIEKVRELAKSLDEAMMELNRSMTLGESFMLWRKELVTVEQVESTPLLDHDEPLGADFQNWVELKAKLRPGDELWTFQSPEVHWRYTWDGKDWY